jgi:RNA polymerase sigma factor (sigma-70 family)
MAIRHAHDHRRSLEQLFDAGALGAKTDGELLDRFRSDPGPAGHDAFRVLVERYGPMVLGLCRSQVSDAHEAEDAFQATFLVLVRGADSIRRRETIGPWLHGVAIRVARRALKRTIRRQNRERPIAGGIPCRESTSLDWPSGEQVIQDEIARLPESLRAPLVQCCLLGVSYDAAARHLRLSVPTLRGRLHRARKLLAARLRARGVTALAIGPGLEPIQIALPTLSSSLIDSTVRFSLRWRALDGLLNGAIAIPGSVTALAQGAIKSMVFQACKLPAIVTLLAAGLAGTVVLAQHGRDPAAKRSSNPAGANTTAAETAPGEKLAVRGTLKFADVERKNQAVKQQLSLVIDARFATPISLATVLKHIKQETTKAKPPGLPIYVNPTGLRDVGKSVDSLVKVNLKQQRVSAVLAEALQQVGLSSLVRDGFLLVDSRIGIVEARGDEIDRKLDRILESLGRLEQAR